MTTTQVRDAVKSRLSIKAAVTTWDTTIADMVESAVRRLYPTATLEVASQTVSVFTVNNLGEAEIDISGLATPLRAARRVEAYDGEAWHRITDTLHHGNILTLRGLNESSDTELRIYGLVNYSATTQVPDWLIQALIWYTMAEFYDLLASNKSTYSIYMQNTGARGVDNMQEQSEYYDQKAEMYVEKQSQVYGT